MSHPSPHHDRENERVEDSKFAPRKGVNLDYDKKPTASSLRKSIRRHALKEVDRKWAPRLAQGKAMSKALEHFKNK